MSRTSTACASISLRLTVLSLSLPSLSCELCPGLIDAENDLKMRIELSHFNSKLLKGDSAGIFRVLSRTGLDLALSFIRVAELSKLVPQSLRPEKSFL